MECSYGCLSNFDLPPPESPSGRNKLTVPLGTFQGDDRHAVRDTAYSVATWTWAGGGPIDHSPAAQSRRGIKSGWARRLRTRERDGMIVELAIQGETQAKISGALDVPQPTVSYVIRRDCPIFARGRGGRGQRT